jgi:DNA-binding NarL/FixJ family response regulator
MVIDGRISVLLVNDRPLLLEGLRMLVGSARGLELAGETATEDADVVTARHRPNVVVLDVDLASDEGLLAVSRLAHASPRSRLLVLTDTQDRARHRAAALAGACGLVTKEHPPQTLLEAIRKVHTGEPCFERQVLDATLDQTFSTSRPLPRSDGTSLLRPLPS